MKKSKKPKTRLDTRNQRIRQMWKSRLYTKAEIGRLSNLTRERIRQILSDIDVEVPYISNEIDWQTIRELRKLFGIKTAKSTYRLLERNIGTYQYPSISISSTEYVIYVLETILSKLIRLNKLLDKLDLSQT